MPPVDHWQKRHGEETTIVDYLANSQTRLIGLVGAGGYGKSALAAQIVTSVDDFDTVLWANFQIPTSFETFARWLIKKLLGDERYEKVRELYEAKSREELVIEAVNQFAIGRCLLVLDNLETLLREDLWMPYDSFLTAWLGSHSRGKILLTSQIEVQLSRTEAREWIALKRLDREQGVALLRAFGIKGSESDFREFVTSADGHPLLLQAAASSLIQQARSEYDIPAIHLLRRDPLTLFREIFTSHRGDSEASVGKVLDQSFDRVSPILQRLLLRLSVLRRGFGLDEAQGLVDEPLELEDLRMLARWSFVREQRSGKVWQFSFLPLIKLYLQEKAQETGEDRAGRERAITRLLQLRKVTKETIVDCAEELEIFHHHCELGQYASAYGVMADCVEFLDRRGYYRELVLVYERLTLEWQAQNQTNLGDQTNLGLAWKWLGSSYGVLSEYQRAIDCFQYHHKIACEIGNRQNEANALRRLGDIHGALSQHQVASEFLQQSLLITQEIDDRKGEANTLSSLGSISCFLQEYQKAIKLCEQSGVAELRYGD